MKTPSRERYDKTRLSPTPRAAAARTRPTGWPSRVDIDTDAPTYRAHSGLAESGEPCRLVRQTRSPPPERRRLALAQAFAEPDLPAKAHEAPNRQHLGNSVIGHTACGCTAIHARAHTQYSATQTVDLNEAKAVKADGAVHHHGLHRPAFGPPAAAFWLHPSGDYCKSVEILSRSSLQPVYLALTAGRNGQSAWPIRLGATRTIHQSSLARPHDLIQQWKKRAMKLPQFAKRKRSDERRRAGRSAARP